MALVPGVCSVSAQDRATVRWPDAVKGYIAWAEAAETTDPVRALECYQRISNQYSRSLPPPNRKVVEDKLAALRPEAAKILLREISVARSKADSRSLGIIKFLADKLALVDVKAEPDLSSESANNIWKLSGVESSILPGDFTTTAPSSQTIKAKEGFQLLRVRFKVENISKDSDPSYVGTWCEDELPASPAFPGARRWIDGSMVHLLQAASANSPTAGSYEAVSLGFQFGSADQFDWAAMAVTRMIPVGAIFGVDAVFSVPRGSVLVRPRLDSILAWKVRPSPAFRSPSARRRCEACCR